MLTKTKINNKEKNGLETNHSFSIPKSIQSDINEKGFHLYNWIGEKDVKLSIERDFLKYISKFGAVAAVLLILPSAILFAIESPIFFGYFFGGLGFINFLLLIFLIIISIKRSSILRKNANILITDSSVSINGKIRKLEKGQVVSNENLDEIGKLFEEKLFSASNIAKSKKGFLKQVTDQLTIGFGAILKMGRGGSRDSGKAVLLLLALYLVYAISLGIIYFAGIILIWIFGIIISIVNKQILLISGHKITKINDNFESIDSSSKSLIKEKNNLSKLLTNAMNNDWKDSLLTKINSKIEKINDSASNAVDTSLTLKRDIKQSKYKQMFNFSIYNSWIKKQIYIPLEQILELLQKNIEILKSKKENIEKQISETKDDSLQGPLVASKTRILMRISEIEKHMKNISLYMNKLI